MGNKLIDNLVSTQPEYVNLSDKGIKEFPEKLGFYLFYL